MRTVPLDERERECGNSRPLADWPGHVEEFTRKDGARRIVARLFWGITNIGEDSKAFFCMAKEGSACWTSSTWATRSGRRSG